MKIEGAKWQQCLKTLAEIRPQTFKHWRQENSWGFALVKSKGSIMRLLFSVKTEASQDGIDEIAALLGKRIYVYLVWSMVRGKEPILRIQVTDLQFNRLDMFDTDQTEKLEATKEGLMSIVEKMK